MHTENEIDSLQSLSEYCKENATDEKVFSYLSDESFSIEIKKRKNPDKPRLKGHVILHVKFIEYHIVEKELETGEVIEVEELNPTPWNVYGKNIDQKHYESLELKFDDKYDLGFVNLQPAIDMFLMWYGFRFMGKDISYVDHLRSMWRSRVYRSTKLIIPQVTYSNGDGHLNNQDWAFNVSYGFREALDISIETRIKKGTPYPIWTQGSVLSFKEGDLIHSQDKTVAIQVKYANRMGWDKDKHEMYLGSVVFKLFDVSDGQFIEKSEHSSNQMEFLEILKSGKIGLTSVSTGSSLRSSP